MHIKHVTKTLLENLKLPIPKTPEKLQYWVDRISKPYEEKNCKLKEIQELEKKVQDRIQEIIDNEECDEKELGEICEIWCGKVLSKNKAVDGIYNVYGGGGVSYTHNEYNL